jgi:hypothetical protein
VEGLRVGGCPEMEHCEVAVIAKIGERVLDYHVRIRGAHRPRNGVATAATFDMLRHGRHRHWLMNPSQM